jgi:hypothetical protein
MCHYTTIHSHGIWDIFIMLYRPFSADAFNNAVTNAANAPSFWTHCWPHWCTCSGTLVSSSTPCPCSSSFPWDSCYAPSRAPQKEACGSSTHSVCLAAWSSHRFLRCANASASAVVLSPTSSRSPCAHPLCVTLPRPLCPRPTVGIRSGVGAHTFVKRWHLPHLLSGSSQIGRRRRLRVDDDIHDCESHLPHVCGLRQS